MAQPNDLKRIKGGDCTFAVVGNAAFDIAARGKRGFAITVRVTGTIVSAVSVQDEGGSVRAYVPTWLGISLNQGETWISEFPMTSITLTAASDSIQIHADKPY